MVQGVFDCKARLATSQDVDRIIAFYERHHTRAVYLRKREEIEHSVNNDLFLLVENPVGEIIAASGVYLLNDGNEIEQCLIDDGGVRRGRAMELGSVLRRKDGLPEHSRVKGVWHPFLFSVPMILLLDRMRRNGGIDADFLVCDVQTDLVKVKRRLLGTPTSPLRWELIEAGSDLKAAFKKTVRDDDKNVDNAKEFFKASIRNLPLVAEYLLDIARDPDSAMTNLHNEKLRIDLSDLIERWTLSCDADGRRYTVLNRLADFEKYIGRSHLGQREFALQFSHLENVVPKQLVPRKQSRINGRYKKPVVGPAFRLVANDTTTAQLPAPPLRGDAPRPEAKKSGAEPVM